MPCELVRTQVEAVGCWQGVSFLVSPCLVLSVLEEQGPVTLPRYFLWGARSVLTAGVLLQVESEGMGEGGGSLRRLKDLLKAMPSIIHF